MGIDTDRGFESDVFGNPGFYVWRHEQQVSYDSTDFMRPRGGERGGGGGGCLYSCSTIVTNEDPPNAQEEGWRWSTFVKLFCVVGRRGGEREGGNSVRGKFDEGREEGELSEE